VVIANKLSLVVRKLNTRGTDVGFELGESVLEHLSHPEREGEGSVYDLVRNPPATAEVLTPNG
jgi:hypothetical protein